MAAAAAPARRVLPRLLRRDARRLLRSVKAVAEAREPLEHDGALHEARKKAKRFRYAAESAVPVFGKRAATLAASAQEVQDALGRQQDTVVARATLIEYGLVAHRAGEDSFTFGRLHALEQRRSEKAERDFADAWTKVRVKGLRRWIAR